MVFKLRIESVALGSNLENFEADQKAAAIEGPASLDAFKDRELTKAVQEGPEPSTSSTESSSDSSTSSDDGGGDIDFGDEPDTDNLDEPEDEPEEDPEPEAEPEPEPEGSEPEIKTEHFREVLEIPKDFSLRMESSILESFSAGAMQAWSGFSYVVGVLTTAGINYGPSVLSGMFKVVLYTFARVFQLLNMMGTACSQGVERYLNSYDKQKKRLETNVGTMKDVIEKGGNLPESIASFKFESTVLNVSNSRDLARIIRDQANFTTKTFGTLLAGARFEFHQLREISNNRYIGKHFDALYYLNDQRSFPGMVPLTGVRMSAPEGTEFYSLGVMPAGGFQCVATLPKEADNWSQIEKNYNSAGFSLIGSGSGVLSSLDPCSPKQLVELMAAIDYMVESNKKHQLFYEELASARTGVFTSVRALFIQLVRSQTRIGFKDSVALPLFLKTSIATKVYLVAAMDLQDHNAKVIANALDYVERVQKLYRVPSAKELTSSF